MKKYIWLNPVVISSYNKEDIKNIMDNLGYTIVNPIKNHLKIVLEKYKNKLKNSNDVIVDYRCPLIKEYFEKDDDFIKTDIEPILIHVAIELSQREDLKDGIKVVITPCNSLKEYGNSLNLDNTVFYTWDEFVIDNSINIKGKKLNNSPIPFGFFDAISNNVFKISKDNIDTNKNKLKKHEIIEGLYCKNGCHNGDGVKCIKKQ